MQDNELQIDLRRGVVIFVFSLGLLLYELCLTRVLSVVFYYHTAFLAISLAMLGLGAGGVWVYLRPTSKERVVEGWMLAVASGIALQVVFLANLRFDVSLLERVWSLDFLPIFGLVALTSFFPFFGGGIIFSSWFRRYQKQATKVYAWDLLGAAFGALALVPIMSMFGGLGGLLACAILIGSAALLSTFSEASKMRLWSSLATASIATLCIAQVGWGVMEIQIDRNVKKGKGAKVLYKKWNAFSRVVVLPQQGWYRGLSQKRKDFWKGKTPPQVEALIDINAFAPLVQYKGDLRTSLYLKELVSNIAHHLLPPKRKVLILGPGGGKDILSALHFRPKEVVGIELNPILVNDVVKDRFREFTGDLYRHPKVRVLLAEGRAGLTRLDERFDIIIANSVVTWAANSSGAMDLAEHHLYTEEACDLYLKRLTKTGILSISLWDISDHALPIRWISTCAKAAKKYGVKDLKQHAAVIANPWDNRSSFSTILLSKSPWSKAQRDRLMELTKKWSYHIHYLPGYVFSEAAFKKYFQAPEAFVKSFRFDVRPATDDRPFFLYTVRWRDALQFWKPGVWEEDAALINLLVSLCLVSFLLLLMIALPLLWHRYIRGKEIGMSVWEMVYFGGIGLGFMFVEIPLIQRLTLFLGHPTYALTVVLAGLLLWCGLGSLYASSWTEDAPESLQKRLTILLGVVALMALVLPYALEWFLPFASMWHIGGRIVLTLVVLFPFGFVMGMPLPLGMSRFEEDQQQAIPWAWGLNGGSGVVASILAIWVAAQWGFRFTFLLAAVCYLVVCLCAYKGWRPSD
ncbi:MAG TPA: hypothetical protein DCE42_04815 [Myxococcales bacterium]|nr:hypothetical protein [Deltaproteobacteria bacterium]HAA54051.1 hypothetical protein [Myxococcales bacterium]|tara:strand:- start:1294 stop:3696 length:2403 start_codon:yes stop_codon:yes gene_type:complete